MLPRQRQILRGIVTRFIASGEPVGSRALAAGCSSATVRNDMAALEERGLLRKPHTSGGRIPTTAAYRIFVNEFLDSAALIQATPSEPNLAAPGTPSAALLAAAVAALAGETGLLAFALMPDGRTYFLGLSKLIRTPEFSENPEAIAGIAELLEESPKFAALLAALPLGEGEIRVWIGAEKALPFPVETSLVAAPAETPDGRGVVGLLGPTRMDYPRALAAMKRILEAFGLARGPVGIPASSEILALPSGE